MLESTEPALELPTSHTVCAAACWKPGKGEHEAYTYSCNVQYDGTKRRAMRYFWGYRIGSVWPALDSMGQHGQGCIARRLMD